MPTVCSACGRSYEPLESGTQGVCPHCGGEALARAGPAPPTVDLVPRDGEDASSVPRERAPSPGTEVSEIACPVCGQPVLHRSPNERVECVRCGTSFIPSMLLKSARAGAPPMTLAGYRLGGYCIGERLGSGGFGIVYRATHAILGREAAVKIISPAFARDPEIRERFTREARLASALEHPGIVKVFEAGLDGDVFYLAMEFVNGKDLAEIVRETGRPDPAEAARIIASTCSALGAAHKAGILHRDIKPENILISDAGEVKLTDFGVARRLEASTVLTRTGGLVGTPGYIAPELAEGELGDERSDIYSLGATLYFLLTGSHPYADEHPIMVLFYRRAEQVPPARDIAPDVPRTLSDIAARMLAKSPSERYPSADAVARDLATFLGGGEVRVDVPVSDVPESELPFGVVALRNRLVTERQLLHCILLQEQARAQGRIVPPLGEIMVREGLVSPEKIPRVLGLEQRRARPERPAPGISVKQRGRSTVVLVSGSCGHDDLVSRLKPVMEGVMARGAKEVVLDLRALRSVATDTASEILVWAEACKARRKHFSVRCDHRAREKFARLGLVEVAGWRTVPETNEDGLPLLPEAAEDPEPPASGEPKGDTGASSGGVQGPGEDETPRPEEEP